MGIRFLRLTDLYSALRVVRTLDLECAFHARLSLVWLPYVLLLGNFEILPHVSTSNLFWRGGLGSQGPVKSERLEWSAIA